MIPQSAARDLERLLDEFSAAWNRHDLDALMAMMTDDGVFEASGGNAVNGERHVGQQAVRAAYAAVFGEYPDARWNNARHFVHGDRGVSEWTFTGTRKDGQRMEVAGCDLLTFRNGKIAVKNSFRKNRPPIGSFTVSPSAMRGAFRAARPRGTGAMLVSSAACIAWLRSRAFPAAGTRIARIAQLEAITHSVHD